MIVACVHFPHFAAAVEQRRRAIDSAPLLIGESTIFDRSALAEKRGVEIGMRTSEAVAICPNAVTLESDIPYYEHCFEAVLDSLEEFSPVVEPAELGTAYLLLDGLPDEPKKHARRLIDVLISRYGLTVSLGIGSGKFVAAIAARTTSPRKVEFVPFGAEPEYLEHLPVEFLPLGISQCDWLRLLGFSTIGHIAQLSLGQAQAQLGSQGKLCWELARGNDSRPVIAQRRDVSVVESLELESPSISLPALQAALKQLLRRAFQNPLAKDKAIRQMDLKLHMDRSPEWSRAINLHEASADHELLDRVLSRTLERVTLTSPVVSLEIALKGLTAESGRQQQMWPSLKARQQSQVEEIARQLKERYGRPYLGNIVEVASWSPYPENRYVMADLIT
jgi:DNA polymerase-4